MPAPLRSRNARKQVSPRSGWTMSNRRLWVPPVAHSNSASTSPEGDVTKKFLPETSRLTDHWVMPKKRENSARQGFRSATTTPIPWSFSIGSNPASAPISLLLQCHLHCLYVSQTEIFDLEILFKAVSRSFAAQTGLFDAAEWRNLGREQPLVQADHSGLQRLRHPKRATDITGENVCCQAEFAVVRPRDRVLLVGEPEQRGHRTERL